MLLRSNLTPAEITQRCKTRKKWQPYTYINGVSVRLVDYPTHQMSPCVRSLRLPSATMDMAAPRSLSLPRPSSWPVVSAQVYLENPKQEEGAGDDPAIMTSHIIRAPPVLCAQVSHRATGDQHLGLHVL
jgi:hypothetical protein